MLTFVQCCGYGFWNRTFDSRCFAYPPVLLAGSYGGVRRACARYLDQFGFQVEEASTVDSAVAILARLRPHVAIADAALLEPYPIAPLESDDAVTGVSPRGPRTIPTPMPTSKKPRP
jgi:hypothetical protein